MEHDKSMPGPGPPVATSTVQTGLLYGASDDAGAWHLRRLDPRRLPELPYSVHVTLNPATWVSRYC